MKDWDPFSPPRPTIDCLLHEAVLVQAWKKSHAYIRSRNWYADTLELDRSAADLPKLIRQWRRDEKALHPTPCRLVPAPKAWPWHFAGGKHPEWRPHKVEKLGDHRLRPLAHLDIRSQTLFTALMICVADPIESLQKEPTAWNNKVSSYGNRLFCDWNGDEEPKAAFRWANATSYRKYFQDYRSFLDRPKQLCLDIAENSSNKVGIVVIDLSRFYDRIQPDLVLEKLRNICDTTEYPMDDRFFAAAQAITHWVWDEEDVESFGRTKLFSNSRPYLPLGLPQGGVASGFFSNIDMLDFDQAIRNKIKYGWELSSGLEIHDYVRYVDDMRLVIRYPNEFSEEIDAEQIKQRVYDAVVDELAKYAPNHRCNDDKTKYLPIDQIETQGSDAALMESISKDMSGPMDRDALENNSRMLDGLLASLDTAVLKHEKAGAEGDASPKLKLATIHRKVREVRDDTIIRFAGYRQYKAFRERRRLAGEHGSPANQVLDAEIDLSVSRLVHFWAHDPSLAPILRWVFELAPDAGTLQIIVDAAEPYITLSRSTDVSKAGSLTVLYAIADLLRSLATRSQHAAPMNAEIDAVATKLARRMVNKSRPWYVRQQAALYLLANQKPRAVYRNTQSEIEFRMMEAYQHLAQMMDSDLSELEDSGIIPDVATLAVALQLTDPKEREAFLAEYLKPLEKIRKTRIKHEIQWIMPELESVKKPRPVKLLQDKDLSLASVTARHPNPFGNEIAAIRLLLALLDVEELFDPEIDRVSINDIRVQCRDWEQLDNASASETNIDLIARFKPKRSIYRGPGPDLLPDWAEGPRRWKMALGMIVRSAFMGIDDPTAFWRPDIEPACGYRGVRSSWVKRRYGMFHRPDGLAGPFAACSSWLSELLSHMLAWPGGLVREDLILGWDNIDVSSKLRKRLKRHLNTLQEHYAEASRLPVYVHNVQRSQYDQPLRLAMVQTVRPWDKEFKHSCELNGAKERSEHRQHLATMLRLTEAHLNAKSTYEPVLTEDHGKPPLADLTLLPEVAVHLDDLDLIERYVDRTRSTVFCGMVFYPKRIGKKNLLINEGRWIIRDEATAGRSIRHIAQGKHHLTANEAAMGVCSHRPYQAILQYCDQTSSLPLYKISGSICYDATDLAIATDLRNITDFYAILANNKDVTTFDAMAAAYRFHMFQHIAIVNSGEFGGSLVQAPYKESYDRILTHQHGGANAAVSIIDIHLSHYKFKIPRHYRKMKSRPAGMRRLD